MSAIRSTERFLCDEAPFGILALFGLAAHERRRAWRYLRWSREVFPAKSQGTKMVNPQTCAMKSWGSYDAGLLLASHTPVSIAKTSSVRW